MKHRNDSDHEPINKPILVILDDVISSGVSLSTGQIPRLMTAVRHNNISTIVLL
tara:strand:+ start:44 stop:205 length:162 start_codon:yes stop_codon:yes gene_type:complete